jgi:hypothetical protein
MSAIATAVASPTTCRETAPRGFPGEAALATEDGATRVPEEDMTVAVATLLGNLIVALPRSTTK